MHGLHDAGEEGLGSAMTVVGTSCQQEIFELIEGHDDGDLEPLEHLHEYL